MGVEASVLSLVVVILIKDIVLQLEDLDTKSHTSFF